MQKVKVFIQSNFMALIAWILAAVSRPTANILDILNGKP
jgi:hypothetical protein